MSYKNFSSIDFLLGHSTRTFFELLLDIRIARVDCFGNLGQILRQMKRLKSFHCHPQLEELKIIISGHVTFHAYPEIIIAMGTDIIAQLNNNS